MNFGFQYNQLAQLVCCCFIIYTIYSFYWGSINAFYHLQLGGPSWKVKLGRRDSITASRAAANNSIPGPNLNISALLSRFAAQGLSLKDLVALSGKETLSWQILHYFKNDQEICQQYKQHILIL